MTTNERITVVQQQLILSRLVMTHIDRLRKVKNLVTKDLPQQLEEWYQCGLTNKEVKQEIAALFEKTLHDEAS
jgi:hypothetical protein